jgi:hypothetical protein
MTTFFRSVCLSCIRLIFILTYFVIDVILFLDWRNDRQLHDDCLYFLQTGLCSRVFTAFCFRDPAAAQTVSVPVAISPADQTVYVRPANAIENIGSNTSLYLIKGSCDLASIENDEVKSVKPEWKFSVTKTQFIPPAGKLLFGYEKNADRLCCTSGR